MRNYIYRFEAVKDSVKFDGKRMIKGGCMIEVLLKAKALLSKEFQTPQIDIFFIKEVGHGNK